MFTFYSANSPTQQSTGTCRHVAPIGRIILIPSQQVFALTHLSCVFSEEAANTNCVLFCLTHAGLEPTIYRTLTITPPIRFWKSNGSFHLHNINSYYTLINVILLINYCCIFFWQIFFGDTITSLFGFMSGKLSFIFDYPIICKTFKYINQLDNSYWQVLSFLDHCRSFTVILTVTACVTVSTERITTITNSLNIMAEISN